MSTALLLLILLALVAWKATRPAPGRPTAELPPAEPATPADLRAAGLDPDTVHTALRAAGLSPDHLMKLPLNDPDVQAFRIDVPSASALEIWRKLRAAVPSTGAWPVVLRDPKQLPMLLESTAADGPTLAERRAAAQALDPDHWFTERETADPEYYLRDPGPWPRHATPTHTFSLHSLLKPQKTLPLALFPTQDGADIPLMLRYGDWNDCPSPEAHAALLRRWHAAWGAELVSIGWDTLELQVARSPETREAALALARELFLYDGDLVYQGTETLSNLAASLIGSTVWSFWWD